LKLGLPGTLNKATNIMGAMITEGKEVSSESWSSGKEFLKAFNGTLRTIRRVLAF
jgi:hypothetical protein